MPIAIEMKKYGLPSVLIPVEVVKPTPDVDDIVIEVIASAVNRADCEIRAGKWLINHPAPFPYTPGIETLGKVIEVGENVKLELGSLVITMMQKMAGIHGLRKGGYQDYVKVPASTVALISKATDPIQLAGLGLAGVTALEGILRLHLKPGDRVLIHGGTGGVGGIAIQLAKISGAYVIASSHGKGKQQLLEELGVDEIWDIAKQDLITYCQKPIDAVFEMVGGKVFCQSVALLKRGGHLCSIGALTGGEANLSIWHLLQELHLTGWSSENLDQNMLQKAIDRLAFLLQKKLIHSPVITQYPLSKASLAHEALEAGSVGGRILLIPNQ